MLHQHFKIPQGGGAIRSYYLAKALVDRGHKVVVISAFNEKNNRIEIIEGIEVHYLPIAYDNRFKFYARAWSFVKYMISSARLAREFKDVDKIYAISVPLTVGIVSRWIKFRFGIPYIFEVGDLWPDAPIQMEFVKNKLFQNLLYSMERKIYREAESVVALSTSIQSAIEKKIPGKKVYLVPNMADCEFYKPEERNSALESKFDVTGKFVVSYIGALGVANGLDYLIQCAVESQQANLPVQFIICGDGAMKDNLIKSVEQLHLRNVFFPGFLTRDGVRELMNVTDAAFICYKHVPILETGSPNKFFDGLAAGKLIVINFGGWIRREIEDHSCGFFSDPDHPSDFVKKITPFLSDEQLLKKYQHASRQLALSKYSREKLSNAFSDLFASPLASQE